MTQRLLSDTYPSGQWQPGRQFRAPQGVRLVWCLVGMSSQVGVQEQLLHLQGGAGVAKHKIVLRTFRPYLATPGAAARAQHGQSCLADKSGPLYSMTKDLSRGG